MAMRDDPPWWFLAFGLLLAVAFNLAMLAGAVWLVVYMLRALGVIS